MQDTTLDEPVSETLKRDLQRVGRKMLRVVFPNSETKDELRNWDLWGPLIVCLFLAILLSRSGPYANATGSGVQKPSADESALVFAAVFVIVWCGAAVVTLNAKMLGGNVSFFQCICVLGYCVFPLAISAVCSLLVCWIVSHAVASFVLRFAVICVGYVWSVRASSGFLSEVLPVERRALSVYPVCLFYVVIAWIIMIRSSGE